MAWTNPEPWEVLPTGVGPQVFTGLWSSSDAADGALVINLPRSVPNIKFYATTDLVTTPGTGDIEFDDTQSTPTTIQITRDPAGGAGVTDFRIWILYLDGKG